MSLLLYGYSAEHGDQGHKYNAHNYLTKPFDDPDAVLAAVENGLAERQEVMGE